jgi:hypothetical protein
MNLYLLEQDVTQIGDLFAIDHYIELAILCPIIKDLKKFPRDGLLFQSTQTISEETSIIFKAEHYTHAYLKEKLRSCPNNFFNNNSMLFEYKEVKDMILTEDFFVKPESHIKSFGATVFKKGEMLRSLNLSDDHVISLSPVKDMTDTEEYRFVVFQNDIIHMTHQFESEKLLPFQAYAFASRLTDYFKDDIPAYVMDVISYKGSFYIVELNPIETSGFVKDYQRLIDTLTQGSLL